MEEELTYYQIKDQIYSEFEFKRKKQTQIYWNAVKKELIKLYNKNFTFAEVSDLNKLYKEVAIHQKLEGETIPEEIEKIFTGKISIEYRGRKIMVGDPNVKLPASLDLSVKLDKYSIIPAIKQQQYSANRELLTSIEKMRSTDNIYDVQRMYKSELSKEKPDERILVALNKKRAELHRSDLGLARQKEARHGYRAREQYADRNLYLEAAIADVSMKTHFSKNPKKRAIEIEDALNIYNFKQYEITQYDLYEKGFNTISETLSSARARVKDCVARCVALQEQDPKYEEREYFKFLVDHIASIKERFPKLRQDIEIRELEEKLKEDYARREQELAAERKKEQEKAEYEEMREKHSQSSLDENMVMDSGRYLGR